jgi:hypothetical protein
MFELLDADYIMFDAFAFYGDPILSQLLDAFIKSPWAQKYTLLFEYPKLTISFMKVISAICRHHLLTLIQVSPMFFSSIFELIYDILKRFGSECVKYAVQTSLLLSQFFIDNVNNQSIQTFIQQQAGVIHRLILVLFEQLLNNSKTDCYILFKTLRNYFLITAQPPFHLIKTQILSFVPETKHQEYNTLFDQIIQTFNIGAALDESHFHQALNSLRTFIIKLEVTVVFNVT